MSEYYILDGKKAVPATFQEWLDWCVSEKNAGRDYKRVAQTVNGEVNVSTVFLDLNHAWGGGPPMIFETMIFGGEHDQYQERCSTWDEAENMHKEACRIAGVEP